jgi:hypothetical protein
VPSPPGLICCLNNPTIADHTDPHHRHRDGIDHSHRDHHLVVEMFGRAAAGGGAVVGAATEVVVLGMQAERRTHVVAAGTAEGADVGKAGFAHAVEAEVAGIRVPVKAGCTPEQVVRSEQAVAAVAAAAQRAGVSRTRKACCSVVVHNHTS